MHQLFHAAAHAGVHHVFCARHIYVINVLVEPGGDAHDARVVDDRHVPPLRAREQRLQRGRAAHVARHGLHAPGELGRVLLPRQNERAHLPARARQPVRNGIAQMARRACYEIQLLHGPPPFPTPRAAGRACRVMLPSFIILPRIYL